MLGRGYEGANASATAWAWRSESGGASSAEDCRGGCEASRGVKYGYSRYALRREVALKVVAARARVEIFWMQTFSVWVWASAQLRGATFAEAQGRMSPCA